MKYLKNARKLTWFVGIMIFAILSLTLISCSNNNDAYDYPIKPGMDEWKTLGSLDTMFNACQIPEATLQKMSTAGLVETVLNYPLLLNYMAYNFRQQGFDVLVANFNGLPELLSRKDACTELLARYRVTDPLAFKDGWTDIQKVDYGWNISHIEMLLSQQPILANLTDTQCHDLIKEAMTKYEAKQQDAAIYGHMGLESSSLVMARVLQHVNYAPFMQKIGENIELRNFLNTGSFTSDTILNEISSQAQQYLSAK